MSRFLRKAFPFRRQIVENAFPPSTFHLLLCVQTQLVSLRYASSNSSSSNGHSFTASYLIDTGFSLKEAASISKRVSFETRDKPDLVINFLKNQGFSQPQILHFIKEVPEFLRYDPEKTFLPKIEFFKSSGVSNSHIPRLLCTCPNIMRRSLSKKLIPSFNFFRDFFQSDDKLIQALKSCSAILVDINACVVPNIKQLREAGFPESNVIKLLQFFPKTLTQNPSRLKKIVEELEEIGFNPLKFQFLMALHVCSWTKESTLAKKADVYKKWGWSENDILAAFKKYPFCMTLSKDKIDAAMEFLVLKLGFDSSTISTNPAVLGYSLEKRIVPRGAVIQVLSSKGLVKKKISLGVFVYTENEFLRRAVLCHEKEASELLELYRAKLDLAR